MITPNHLALRLVILPLVALASPAIGQTRQTEHTFSYSESDPSPSATLRDVAWLQGAWEGSGFGGISEEIWSEPLGGAMMGAYRSVENGSAKFFELCSIVETGGSLELRLKHFHSDLKGWEERDAVRIFPLVKIADRMAYFDGMTYVKTGKSAATVYLALSDKKGGIREIVFKYRKRRI